MTAKVSHVKNPLTIIAIFAGLAEVGGTAVLPLLEASIQNTYVWFLMLFPVFLVGIFFAVLFFKHEVLYAPSDFRDDKTFHSLVAGKSEAFSMSVSSGSEKKGTESHTLPNFESLTPSVRKVLKTLWNFQNASFPNDDTQRWGFGVALGSPDYSQFRDGVEALSKHQIVMLNNKGLCFLTDAGLDYCRDNSSNLGGEKHLWSKF